VDNIRQEMEEKQARQAANRNPRKIRRVRVKSREKAVRAKI